MARYRAMSYADLLARIGSAEHEEISITDNRHWQLEIQFFWDDKPNGDIRVLGAIDDGGFRVFFPITDSFILAPTGAFIDE